MTVKAEIKTVSVAEKQACTGRYCTTRYTYSILSIDSLLSYKYEAMAMRQNRAEQVYTWDKETRTFLPVTNPGATKGLPLFLKGPIPWQWIIRASELPGKALVVGLCLWRLKGATKKNTISLSNTELEPFGVDRTAKSRALAALERADLVSIERQPGRWSTVTLLQGPFIKSC